ncbi:unnamed protein product [Darwinula stevensoni]|uniref:Uncharacterized protein n=1 Tax=Darwinula stevensoni TaxID=69355 RepID=A0A7R8X1N9_9CRUS|nr:unnamed protein product [Darwinula stevensoni]CAG0882488.1 unnamed protein product [Darwinula stevensoni]
MLAVVATPCTPLDASALAIQNILTTWEEARDNCTASDKELIWMDSETWTALRRLLQSNGSFGPAGTYFIGNNLVDDPATQSTRRDQWWSDANVPPRWWDLGRPGSEPCAVLAEKGSGLVLKDVPCQEPHGFICAPKRVLNPGNLEALTDEMRDYTTALIECRHHGKDLLKITSQDDLQVAKQFMKDNRLSGRFFIKNTIPLTVVSTIGLTPEENKAYVTSQQGQHVRKPTPYELERPPVSTSGKAWKTSHLTAPPSLSLAPYSIDSKTEAGRSSSRARMAPGSRLTATPTKFLTNAGDQTVNILDNPNPITIQGVKPFYRILFDEPKIITVVDILQVNTADCFNFSNIEVRVGDIDVSAYGDFSQNPLCAYFKGYDSDKACRSVREKIRCSRPLTGKILSIQKVPTVAGFSSNGGPVDSSIATASAAGTGTNGKRKRRQAPPSGGLSGTVPNPNRIFANGSKQVGSWSDASTDCTNRGGGLLEISAASDLDILTYFLTTNVSIAAGSTFYLKNNIMGIPRTDNWNQNCHIPPTHKDAFVKDNRSGNVYLLDTSIGYACPCPKVWERSGKVILESICKGAMGWSLNDEMLRNQSCKPGGGSVQGVGYRLSAEGASPLEAGDRCGELYGGELAELDSEEKLAWIRDYLHDFPCISTLAVAPSALTNWRKVPTTVDKHYDPSGIWIARNGFSLNSTLFDKRLSEPDNHDGTGQQCFLLMRDGGSDRKCDIKGQFYLCSSENKGFHVGDGDTLFYLEGKTAIANVTDFFDAMEFCKTKHLGSELGEITSVRTMQELFSYMQLNFPHAETVIVATNVRRNKLAGLDEGNETIWKFSDGSGVPSQLFDSKYPKTGKGPCAILSVVNNGLFMRNHECSFEGIKNGYILCQEDKETKCGEGPPRVSGASLASSPTTPAPYLQGTEAEYKCDCGKSLKDNMHEVRLTTKCMGQLDWMPFPECVEHCPSDPPEIPKSEFIIGRYFTPATQTTAPYPYDTKVTYACPCGFRWKEASVDGITVNSVASRTVDIHCRGIIGFKYPFSVTECIPDPEISNPCVPNECVRDPPFVKEANRTWNGKYDIGTIVSYYCYKSRWFADTKTQTRDIKCKNDGLWEDLLDAKCVFFECPNPPQDPTSTDMMRSWKSTDKAIGKNASYTCRDGMKLNANQTDLDVQGIQYSKNGGFITEIKLSCLSNGSWEYANMECGIITCPGDPPSAPNQGTRQWNGSATVGTQATYRCPQSGEIDLSATALDAKRIGYMTEQGKILEVTLECTTNGTWQSLTMSCKASKTTSTSGTLNATNPETSQPDDPTTSITSIDETPSTRNPGTSQPDEPTTEEPSLPFQCHQTSATLVCGGAGFHIGNGTTLYYLEGETEIANVTDFFDAMEFCKTKHEGSENSPEAETFLIATNLRNYECSLEELNNVYILCQERKETNWNENPPQVSGASLTSSPMTPPPYHRRAEVKYKYDCKRSLKKNMHEMRLTTKCMGLRDWMSFPSSVEIDQTLYDDTVSMPLENLSTWRLGGSALGYKLCVQRQVPHQNGSVDSELYDSKHGSIHLLRLPSLRHILHLYSGPIILSLFHGGIEFSICGQSQTSTGKRSDDIPTDVSQLDFDRIIAYPNIRLICLASANPSANSVVTIAGWGRTSGTSNALPTPLMETTVNVLSLPACQSIWGTGINSNYVCVQATGKNICNGDSGGSLMY